MFSYSSLPIPLLALLFTALPALSGPPTTPYDSFHGIAIHAPKPPEQPMCCLKLLTPLEDTEEEVLLTFEEWKAKRLAEVHKEPVSGSHPPSSTGHKPGTINDTVEPIPASPPSGTGNAASTSAEPGDVETPPDRVSPHFRIPLTDRFNYASMDCSARVHMAHKSAKSASSILSSKKDRYLLSPCADKNQFVVVELCDDIRIDTVQLADYEFFSGVFKDFSVSVAKTYTSGWVPAGTYRGKNTRGVQSFHPPTSLADFYRFIRIDFHSHYGNEYYCPLSLLRVYGLTHLEHWKWDLWEDESRRQAKEAASVEISDGAAAPPTAQTPASGESATTGNSSFEAPDTHDTQTFDNQRDIAPENVSTSDVSQAPQTESVAIEQLESQAQPIPPSTPPPTAEAAAHLVGEPPSKQSSQPIQSSHTVHSVDQTNSTDSVEALQSSISSDSNHSPPTAIPVSPPIFPSDTSSTDISHTPRESSNTSTQSHTPQSSRPSASSASGTPIHTLHSLAVVPPTTSGESIYRIIMNRLTALEANTTLYARYVEEQIAGVREMMRRLGEDVGRLEGIGMAQAQMYQRSVLEFERHRKRVDLEHYELMSKVSRLTDEVILEKRLGIAQLCLLLAVLLFMALTRGSRGEVVHVPAPAEYQRSRTSSVRDWGKRTLSLGGLGGDWMNRFRSPNSGRDAGSAPVSDATEDTERPTTTGDRVKFPSQVQPSGSAEFPRSKRPHPITSGRKFASNVHHLRTPTALRSPIRSAASHRHAFTSHRPQTPTGPSTASLTSAALISPVLRPPLPRAVSGGTGGIVQSASMGSVIGPVPKSAKRWARSAHLHEVKSVSAITSKASNSVVPVQDVQPTLNGSSADHAEPAPDETSQTVLVGDVFSPQVRTPLAWSPANRRESLTMHLARVGLSPSDMSPSRARVSAVSAGNGDVSEGDAWVDTDVDSSDVDNDDATTAEGEEK